MEEPTCQDCKYFCQHYVYLLKQRYVTTPCGHCIYPRLKHRRPDKLACSHFLKREREEAAPEP